MGTYHLSWGDHKLVFGEQTRIMGVLNVTPDSFSDGGIFFSFDDAVAQGEKMCEDGADILDIGGESTRPFSDSVPAEEEIRRVVPVIEELVTRVSTPISIDTTKSEVARRALEAGAAIINDVSALRLDPGMADLAAAYDVPLILMHMLGTPKTMQVAPAYDDLLGEIKAFLENAIDRAIQKGVLKSKIIIDPGIGFGKTKAHNLAVIRHLTALISLDVPILIGPSRKAFIRNILKDKNLKDIRPDLPVVETGTQAAVAASVLYGAHMVRVHNVASTRATLQIADAIKNA
jgi:dihydropteroate synthase